MSDDSRIDSILGEWRARRDAGEAITPQDVLAAHPELADSLRARFDALAEISAAHQPALREVPEERYADFRVLGAGGMGIVYWALDTDLNRQVAFKVVRPDAGRSDTAAPTAPLHLAPPDGDTPASRAFATLKARFLQEAWVTAGLDHPGIVPVYEVGRTPEGVPYYTMRFVRGSRTLAVAIEETRGAPVDARIALLEPFLRVCDTIRYAHAHGVIHRDLKPENVALGEFGEVVVLDWGLAKMTGRPDAFAETWQHRLQEYRDAADLRTMACALGTPGYMSPEAALGRVAEVDARSDVYSLGAILFEILTGRLPYEFASYGELATKLTREDAPRADALAPSVPSEIASICAMALARDRSRRTRSADALAEDVRGWMASRAQEREIDSLVSRARTALDAAAPLKADLRLRQVDRAASLCDQALAGSADDAAATSLRREIDALRAKGVDERAAATRRRAVQRVAAAALGVLGITLWVAGKALQREAKDAEDARAEAVRESARKGEALERAEALRLVAESKAALAQDPSIALELALEGYDRQPTALARNAVAEALSADATEHVVDVHDIGRIAGLCVSPDGARAVALGQSGAARIVDLAAGVAGASLKGDVWAVDDAQFLGGGTRVVTANADGTARVWDTATGAQLASVGERHLDKASHVALSADGRTFAASRESGIVTVYDVESGRELFRREYRSNDERDIYGNAWMVAFDRVGGGVLSGRPAGLDAYDLPSGVERFHASLPVSKVAWCVSPDGRRFVAGSSRFADRSVRIVDTAGGSVEATWDPGGESAPSAVAVSPDGTRVATAERTVRLFDAATGHELWAYREHAQTVTSLVFDASGRLVASAGGDGTARVLDAATGRALAVLRGHAGRVTSAAFLPGGRVVTSSADGTVRTWRIAGGPGCVVLAGHAGSVLSGAFDPAGGRVATSSADGTARVWDAATGAVVSVMGAPIPMPAIVQEMLDDDSFPRDLIAVSFDASGSRLSAFATGGALTARVFDVASGRELWAARPGVEGEPGFASMSRDGRVVADWPMGLPPRFVDLATGRATQALCPTDDPTLYSRRSALYFGRLSADGARAVGFMPQDAGVTVWRTDTGECTSHPDRQGSYRAAVSRDATAIAVWTPRGPVTTSVVATAAKTTIAAPKGGWASCAFDDRDRLVTRDEAGMRSLWDPATGARISEFAAPDARSVVAFSPDGRSVACADAEGAVRVVGPARPDDALVLRGHTSAVTAIVFAADGRRLLTTSADGTARIWRLDVIEAARGAPVRVLSADERARYDPPDPAGK